MKTSAAKQAPKFRAGDMVRLASGADYLGPVKGAPELRADGFHYVVDHGDGGRKLFAEAELVRW